MPTLLPYGRAAVLLEADDSATALGLHRAVLAAAPAGLVEAVPAQQTLLVTFADATARAATEPLLRALTPLAEGPADHRVVEVPTRYDGPDLDEVAALTGLSREGVIAAHTGATYVVDFVGFAPGFAYLGGVAPELHVPRRQTPRTAVPPGSVALAGDLTAIYPRSSPGGWQLIGSTDLVVWDLGRDEPGLLRPGDRVRFLPVHG